MPHRGTVGNWEINSIPVLHLPGGSAHSSLDAVFNIVLLGKGGTGKSASANTILAAENSLQPMLPSLTIGNSQQDSTPFKSYPSSTPVTTKCETRMMKVGSGKQIRLVDTPDFCHENKSMQEAQLNECKLYCQPGQCVVLLVIQLGRFTEGERGILENLEKLLGVTMYSRTPPKTLNRSRNSSRKLNSCFQIWQKKTHLHSVVCVSFNFGWCALNVPKKVINSKPVLTHDA